jgi:hypothetical protein
MKHFRETSDIDIVEKKLREKLSGMDTSFLLKNSNLTMHTLLRIISTQ